MADTVADAQSGPAVNGARATVPEQTRSDNGIAETIATPGADLRRGAPEAHRTGWRRLVAKAGSLLTGTVKRTAAIAAFLALWEIAPRIGLVDRTFLVPFSEAVRALIDLGGNGQLWDNARASLIRSVVGFGIAVAVAVPLGVLIGWYRPLADLLNPLLELLRNTAALALLPVFVLLLGIGETSKIAIVVYACVWPILLNTISAVRAVDQTLIKSARSMSVSTPQLFAKVILPASLPTIFTGLRMAGAASILVLIAAEMNGAKAGLGYLVNSAQQNFLMADMYAAIIAISLLGLAFNQLLVALERRLTRWRPRDNR